VRSPLLLLVTATLVALAFAACGDPVHDREVAALGPEASGVSPGPEHRPGQPCLVCHGGEGPGGQTFAFAGTVYRIPVDTTPFSGATVKLTDVNKSQATATTNSAGNFYVMASDYSPTYPVNVEVDVGTYSASMSTHVGRDGSCASCHFDPAGSTTHGHVYMAATAGDVPDAGAQ
jgi:hypothetical protein